MGIFSLILRSFVPAWRFFDFVEDAPLLSCRETASSGEWIDLSPSLEVEPWHLFLNPRGTAIHFQDSFLRLFLQHCDQEAWRGILHESVHRVFSTRFQRKASLEIKIYYSRASGQEEILYHAISEGQ